WRKKSPSGIGVFGPIQTSSEFAGITHQYACTLQFPQHRFSHRALPHQPWRIVQRGLLTLDALTFTDSDQPRIPQSRLVNSSHQEKMERLALAI
ncbi:hypothetical protein, partial [Burkholderia ubonensis]|uniref:hypothetical protein n=1 Tax=Burkholderia ubonensis TaxID=101571 RepID=UPI001E43BA5E